MRDVKINEIDALAEQKLCIQCQEMKPLLAFSRSRGAVMKWKSLCAVCEEYNQCERRRRVAISREHEQDHSIWEEYRKQEWQRKVTLRQTHEQRWREREDWYRQQPDRRCRMCAELLPASAFGGISSVHDFILYTRCKRCHAALQEQRQVSCCLCQQKTPRSAFLSDYEGYALCGAGTWISLCCRECEESFKGLSRSRQEFLIRACCQRAFPAGQVIYAEVAPQTGEIRYIGRTGKPKRRHRQHIKDALTRVKGCSVQGTAYYSLGNWISALCEEGLEPAMRILQTVENAALVVEWEQRYIWHAMQQGWRILNVETTNEVLLARIKASSLNFLQAPFEQLVQHGFFSSHGLVAFLHAWTCPDYPAEKILTIHR